MIPRTTGIVKITLYQGKTQDISGLCVLKGCTAESISKFLYVIMIINLRALFTKNYHSFSFPCRKFPNIFIKISKYLVTVLVLVLLFTHTDTDVDIVNTFS